MDKEQQYFYISGFLSLMLFAMILFFFIMMLFSPVNKKIYGLEKDNYISVSVSIAPVMQKKPKQVKKVAPVVNPVSTTEDTDMSEDIDVNDLFSDVWTKKIQKPQIKKVTRRNLDAIRQKIKVPQVKKTLSTKQDLHLNEKNLQSEENSSSKANEVNEYLAKIQAIVYEHFFVPPNTQGLSVKAVIELNALGKLLDFRILQYSSNDALNKEADRIRERLRSVVFPRNPLNIKSRTIILLKSKE